MAEHAQKIREALYECHKEGYTLAVDLPHGLEEQVGKTIKRLPRISLILDELNRAIPVVPSIGSIEAVRTANTLGMRTEFMDASLPFIQDQGSFKELFSTISAHMDVEEYEKLIEPPYSEYMDLRRSYMGLRLRGLLDNGEKVVMVCNYQHHAAVLEKMDKRIEFGCGVVTPAHICHVNQHDVWRMSPDLPYFATLYEMSRQDNNFNRKEAFIKLFHDSESNFNISEILRYSRNLALTDGELYPDLYHLIAAAKFCGDDAYALRVLDKAISYPFTEEKTDCEFSDPFDFDLNPIDDERMLEIEAKLIKGAHRYLVPAKVTEDKSYGVMKLKRPPEVLRKELKFAQYLLNQYQAHSACEEYDTEEFQCGFYEGLDVRQTLRFKFLDKLYVKKFRKENTAAYIVNYGGLASHTIYFDTQSSVVGAAYNSGMDGHSSYPDELCWTCFTLFSQTPEGGTEKLLEEINVFNPLKSCLKVALDHAEQVFLFSQEPIPSEFTAQEKRRIRVFGIAKLPVKLRNGMKCFNLRWMKD